MKIVWTDRTDNGRVSYTAHSGMIFGTYWVDKNGNHPYMVFTRSGGHRRIILSVGNNRGQHRIHVRNRLEFILKCLDNNLSFDLLPNENPKFDDVEHNPANIPEPSRSMDVDGIYIGRVYKHYKGNLYRVLMVTNRGSTRPGFVKTVCYRDIDTGAEWSRSFDEFVPSKYQLVPYGTKRETTDTFKQSERNKGKPNV